MADTASKRKRVAQLITSSSEEKRAHTGTWTPATRETQNEAERGSRFGDLLVLPASLFDAYLPHLRWCAQVAQLEGEVKQLKDRLSSTEPGKVTLLVTG